MRVRYDAIVVLGASGRGREPSPALVRRVRHGVDAFRQGRGQFLVFSGGAPRQPIAEAAWMRALALEAGIAESAIVVEDKSTRTLENAAFTARLMARRGLASALLVTDPFHLPRALYAFRRAGIAAVGSPARSFWHEVAWWWWPVLLARETVAFAVYAWRLRSGMPATD